MPKFVPTMFPPRDVQRIIETRSKDIASLMDTEKCGRVDAIRKLLQDEWKAKRRK